MLLSNLDLLATAPGGVARLRELILTLAVQGKLVPQDPADEPASVLLRKIRAEKDRLIAEGKIKRDKPPTEIAEDEKPFELPSSWAWTRLADVVRVLNGRAYAKQELLDAGRVPVLRVGNLFTSNHWYYSDLELESEKYCEAGDLLYAWSASFGPFIWQGPKAIFHYHIWKLEPWAPQLLDTGYFYRFLAEKTAEIKAAGHGVSMVHMTKEKMEKIVVPYPPLAEQSRIVSRVEELMRLCDALEAKGQLEATKHAQLVSSLLGTLTASATPEELANNWQCVAQHFDLLLDRPEAIDALEQTLLQLAVRGLLAPQDPTDEPASALLARIRTEKDRLIAEGKVKRDKPLPPITEEEKPFELPVGWEWVRFDELTHPQKPIAYGVLVPGPDVTAGVPLVRIADLSLVSPAAKPEKMIAPEVDAQFQRTRLEGGEILMGVVGSIGKLGVAPPTWAGANIARAICRIVPADAGLRDFVLFLLETRFMQDSFAGGTRTLAQPTLNVGLIRAAMTPMPPPAEQSRIVTRVTALRRLCADLRQRLAESQSVQARLAEALVDRANVSSESC